MPNYQGHFMPRPDGVHYMPEAFANFIANENPESISPRETGVIELYSQTGCSRCPCFLKGSRRAGSAQSPRNNRFRDGLIAAAAGMVFVIRAQ